MLIENRVALVVVLTEGEWWGSILALEVLAVIVLFKSSVRCLTNIVNLLGQGWQVSKSYCDCRLGLAEGGHLAALCTLFQIDLALVHFLMT